MQELRQSTAINLKIGAAIDSTGSVPVTNLTVTGADEAEILKNGTTGTLAISGTLSAITGADGWYNMSATADDTSALGPLTIAIHDDSLILPISRDYMIVDQGYYDTKYNSTGSFKASLTAASVDAVWDEVLSGATHNVAASAGRRLRDIASDIVLTGTSPDTGGTTNNAIRIELDGAGRKYKPKRSIDFNAKCSYRENKRWRYSYTGI